MVDDRLLEQVGRALVKLASDADGLEELLVPRQASSGESAGKPPARRGSKPPLSVAMMDLKLETEAVLGKWCGVAVRDIDGVGHAPSSHACHGSLIAARADWLREHLGVLVEQAWAARCFEELIAQASLVADVVAPPCAPVEPIAYGTARQVSRWTAVLGTPVSRMKIRRWIETGRIESMKLPSGEVIVSMDEVLEISRKNGLLTHP